MRWRPGKSKPAVYRITGTPRGLDEDVRGRQRRYVISMLVRTAAVLLTAALWNVSLPLAVVALVLGMVLPYVAVVIANAGRENATRLPTSSLNSPESPALPVVRDRGTPGEHHRR